MHKVNHRIVVLGIFVLLITTLVVVETYALFETNASSTAEFNIGEWVILLNDNDVTETRTLSLSDFTYTNGIHTEDGYFAPGSTASFDLVVDTSESDVSVEYLIDIDDTAVEDYPNIEFSVTNLDTSVTTTTNSYSGVIPLSAQNRVVRLRLNLVWNNLTEYDELDTSLIDGELEFTITANFKQYIGE